MVWSMKERFNVIRSTYDPMANSPENVNDHLAFMKTEIS